MKLILPENLPAEAEVIGSCLRDTNQICQVKLNPDDFMGPVFRDIFAVLQDLGRAATPAAVHEALRTNELYMEGGGENWLKMLVYDSHPGAIRHNVALVKEDARRRNLATLGSNVVQKVADGEDSMSIMGEMREGLLAIQQDMDADEIDVPGLVKEIVSTIKEKAMFEQFDEAGILTGFNAFDVGGGLETGLHSIHGASGLGKTALALNILVNILTNYRNSHVLHFSFEGSARSLVKRILARRAQVRFQMLRKNRADREGISAMESAAGHEFWKRLHIVENTRYADVGKMIAHAEATALKQKLALITVDHLQLMEAPGVRTQNRHLEVSKITRDLSFLAKDLDIPVVVFSQVNEDGQAKESRDIKAHSTNYFALTTAVPATDLEHETIIRVTCEKGRDTGTWVRYLSFIGQFMSYEDTSKPADVEDYPRPKSNIRGKSL